jgi:hypothetical protein
MNHAELDAILLRSENMPDDISYADLQQLHLDTMKALQCLAAAARPFAVAVYHGTPNDCGGVLKQVDWDRLAALFAIPR